MPVQELLSISVVKKYSNLRMGVTFSGESEAPLLSQVHQGGLAAKAGLMVGDILQSIDDEPLATPLAAASMLRQLKGTLTLTVLRTVFTEEDHAAALIASRWRGFEARDTIISWHWSATQIQRSWRGCTTRWDILDWFRDCAAAKLQAVWRGRATRHRTATMLVQARAERPTTFDKKAVNQLRRALSFNRKPRKPGKDGGEFSALLEGSPEDIEARLLARRQQTARTIEKAVGGLEDAAPEAPTDAEMEDPAVMQGYMMALGEFSMRQQVVIQEHEAAARENQWVCEQLQKIDEAKRQERAQTTRRALSFERRKNKKVQNAQQKKKVQQEQEEPVQDEEQPGRAKQVEKEAQEQQDGQEKTEGGSIRRALSFERRKQRRQAAPTEPLPVTVGVDRPAEIEGEIKSESEGAVDGAVEVHPFTEPSAEVAVEATDAALVATDAADMANGPPSRALISPLISPLNGSAAVVDVASNDTNASNDEAAGDSGEESAEARSPQSVMTSFAAMARVMPTADAPVTPVRHSGKTPESAKYKQRLNRARTANRLRVASSSTFEPVLVHPVNA